jgi:serine/threonine-protein kinase
MMTPQPTCARCGTTLTADGSCARCELALAIEVTPAGASEFLESAEPFRRFGDYELLEELGHGGMGVVYRARQINLNRAVALKMLLLGQFSSEQSIRRFQREARAAAALHHPNIVSIYETGEIEGQHYFTMEYVEGRSLASLLRDGPLASRQAAAYCKCIAEAMTAAHKAGILHRDLKPANILIDLFDQPRITDFGLAKWFAQPPGSPDSPAQVREAHANGTSDPRKADITITGQMAGSPNYLAPEYAAGNLQHVGPGSDLYSMGAILYECLTGRPPFLAPTLQETLLRIGDSDPLAPRTLNASVPRDLETVCLKCLEKELERRYRSSQELADDLERFLRGAPVQARSIGPLTKGWRWCRRKPLIASLALALSLAVTLGIAGVLWEWRRAEHNAKRAQSGELDARQRQYASDMNLGIVRKQVPNGEAEF